MPLTTDQAAWVAGVSARTGVDPRVLIAWMPSEGDPGDLPGYFNFLNIKTSSLPGLGVAAIGTEPKTGTAKLGSLGSGVTAASNELKRLGLTNMQGLTPRQQIVRIANSGWAEGKYRGKDGVVGSSFMGRFTSIFSAKALDSAYMGPGSAGAVAATAGTGSAADAASNLPGQGAVAGAATGIFNAGKGIYDTAVAVPRFLGKISSVQFLIRAGEVVGGAALTAMGVFLLARQVGLGSPPVPSVLQVGANRAAATAAQDRSAGVRERSEDRRAASDARRVERSPKLAGERDFERSRQSDEVPF